MSDFGVCLPFVGAGECGHEELGSIDMFVAGRGISGGYIILYDVEGFVILGLKELTIEMV